MSIVSVVTALALALGQGHASFTGMWTAEFGGRTFVRLQLATRDGSIEGALGVGDIHVDSEGAVDCAQEVPDKLVAISNAAAKGSAPTSVSCPTAAGCRQGDVAVRSRSDRPFCLALAHDGPAEQG